MTAASNKPEQPLIAVADSEVLVRHAIADCLRECGYRVIEAATSDEALTVLAEPGFVPNAMLCATAIDGPMNGFELAHHVRAKRPDVPVVLAGTITAAADAAAGLCDEGPQLARPYDPQGVVDYIKRRLAQRGDRRE